MVIILRSGAMAARSPIVRDIVAEAGKGLNVAGFCNGFQILTEAGLLPGALMRNKSLKYVCKPQKLHITNGNSRFTKALIKARLMLCSRLPTTTEIILPMTKRLTALKNLAALLLNMMATLMAQRATSRAFAMKRAMSWV